MRSQLLRAAGLIVVVLVAAFVVLRVFALRGDLDGAPAIERPWLLVPALPLYAAALLTYAFLWRDILFRMDRVRPPVVDSIAVFCASWLGRYVPSSLPYLAGKFMMGRRLGHSKPALAASMLYENALLVSVAAVTSSIIIPLMLAGRGGGPLVYLVAGLGGAAALVFLSPPVFHRFINTAIRLARRQPIPRENLLSFRGILAGSGIAAFGFVLTGTAFALVLRSFVDLDTRELVASAAIFNLAGAIGVAALPLPSGIGVREGILIGLVQLYVPLEVAVAAAVVARLGSIMVDVLLGLAGASVVAWRLRRASSDSEESDERYPVAAPRPAEEYAAGGHGGAT